MKRLYELFGFSFYISGLITYVVGVSWMIYIAWIFFFSICFQYFFFNIFS